MYSLLFCFSFQTFFFCIFSIFFCGFLLYLFVPFRNVLVSIFIAFRVLLHFLFVFLRHILVLSLSLLFIIIFFSSDKFRLIFCSISRKVERYNFTIDCKKTRETKSGIKQLYSVVVSSKFHVTALHMNQRIFQCQMNGQPIQIKKKSANQNNFKKRYIHLRLARHFKI